MQFCSQCFIISTLRKLIFELNFLKYHFHDFYLLLKSFLEDSYSWETWFIFCTISFFAPCFFPSVIHNWFFRNQSKPNKWFLFKVQCQIRCIVACSWMKSLVPSRGSRTQTQSFFVTKVFEVLTFSSSKYPSYIFIFFIYSFNINCWLSNQPK